MKKEIRTPIKVALLGHLPGRAPALQLEIFGFFRGVATITDDFFVGCFPVPAAWLPLVQQS
jgi:hypothetical protein